MAQNKSWKELMELQGASGGSSQQKANAMLELIEGRQPFSYDPNTDPTARAVRQETARNIQRSTQDTLGAHAGMTGGVPSSAAVSAAAQAGNQAAVTGADRIAELEQLARQNYMNEGTQMKNYWGMLQGQADSEYNRQMQEQQIAYQKEQDEYNKKYQMAQDEYNKKYQIALLQAKYGDYSGLKALGVDTSKMETAGGGGGYRGSGGGYRGSGGGSGGSGGSGGNGGGGDDSGLDPDEGYNAVLTAYPGMKIPEREWATLAAKYGEATLLNWGFSKKKATSSYERGEPVRDAGSGGSSRNDRKEIILE